MTTRSTTHDKLRAILEENFEWLEKHSPKKAEQFRTTYTEAMTSNSSGVDHLCEAISESHDIITVDLLKSQ